jgi:tetratricopeptide (TPR) repeat protein
MLAGGSEVLGYAAEALLLAGDHDGAQRQLEQAFQIADKHGERVYLPQLFLIEGAIARARGQRTAALASVRSAIEEARAQEAGWLELLALVELCEHEGAKAKDRQALAVLVDRLPEAAETDAVTRAHALIRGARAAAT